MSFDRIAVLGGGAWGTALANVAARAGRNVTLWEYDAGNAEELASKRESAFLPGVKIDDRIAVTRDLSEAARADAILLVVPAQAMRAVCKALSSAAAPGTPIITCAKGIEHGTRKFMTEIISRVYAQGKAGDSFRAELCRRRGARIAHRGNARGA